jgi:hypothetical protein
MSNVSECITLGGGRNRVRRARRAARTLRRYPLRARVCNPSELAPPDVPELDLAGHWTAAVARVALSRFAVSEQSQRAFARDHSFPVGRLNIWRKRLEVDNSAN